VPALCAEDGSTSVDASFRAAASAQVAADPRVSSRGARASGWTSVCIAVRAQGKRLWYGGACLVLWSVCYSVQPLFIKAILIHVEINNRQDWSRNSGAPPASSNASATSHDLFLNTSRAGAADDDALLLEELRLRNPLRGLSPLSVWLLCVATGLCQIFLLNHAFFNMFRFSFSARLGFMNQVWEKAMRLSSAGKLDPSMGNIQTLMAVDPARIMMGAIGVHWVWLGWVLIAASVGFMAVEIGWVALVPVACLFVIVVIQLIIVRRIGATRRAVVQATDRRVQLTNEFLTGIRMIKMYAWEAHAGTLVENARAKELSALKSLLFLLQANAVIFFMAPITIALATFTTYVMFSGGENAADFDVSKCITVLGFMNLMRLPMALMPKCTGAFVDSLVSHRRIANFLFKGDEVAVRQPFGKNEAGVAKEAVLASPDVPAAAVRLPPRTTFFWQHEHQRQNQSQNNDAASPLESKVDGTMAAQWSLDSGAKGLIVPAGKLVCVCGIVGSGKSSLIAGLLGEMKIVGQNGNPASNFVNGSVALVAQKAWIQNATVREAILFGSKYDRKKYEHVLDASQLRQDLRVLPDGDETEIGDRGLNLSGGQKQRVAIARAIYLKNQKDVFVFDDPLSAVDVHVAGALWDQVICGEQSALHGKTRIVVLNSHYHFLSSADMVVYLKDGVVEVFDRPEEALLAHPTLRGSGKDSDSGSEGDAGLADEKSPLASSTAAPAATSADAQSMDVQMTEVVADGDEAAAGDVSYRQRSTSTASVASSSTSSLVQARRAQKLYSKENRAKGAVTMNSYAAWFDSAAANFSQCCRCCRCCQSPNDDDGGANSLAGLVLLVSVFFTFALSQAGRTLSDLTLTWWSNTPSNSDAYALFGAVSGLTLVAILVRAFLFVYVSIGASQNFHTRIFKAVLDAPVNLFFDITHVGEILNRFSSDLDHIDTQLPEYASQFFQNSLYCLAAMCICAWSSYYFLAMLAPLVILYITVQTLFRKTSRELKRLEGVTRSPIFSAYQEALAGLDTIRAFDVSKQFDRANARRTDLNTSTYLHFQMASRWLALRLDFLGVATFCSVAAFALFLPLPEEQLPVVGLALVYALQITGLLQWTVRTFIETENNMTAVERLEHYRSGIPKERLGGFVRRNDDGKTPLTVSEDWPQHGGVVIKDLRMRYRPGLPLVLRGVTMTIRPQEKVGIVGRTGSGKSSIVQALFRIVESEWDGSDGGDGNNEGKTKNELSPSFPKSVIEIDGVDIARIPLHTLRSKMSVIPQDPVLFSGDIRKNLDPFAQHDDAELWKVLGLVELEPFVRGLTGQLYHHVADSGENFSSGQRQLVCFARALLRKSKIIVMDEATASVDSETDRKLQEMIRTRFVGQTVICIAHRLETILDCDRVCVLDQGRVIEYAPVAELLREGGGGEDGEEGASQNKSVFSGLVKEMKSHES
jgi:ABC-type multidrug transport system fused ATPase/permease subunit